MRIAIYGGSFDPPHLGHVEAARAVLRELEPDKLLIIPAFQPPHKTLSAGSPAPKERLRLTRLAFEGMERTEVSDIEIASGGRSYTVNTLEKLRDIYPDAELVLVMGTDMLLSFEQWRDFRRIFTMAELGTFIRNAEDRQNVCNFAAYLRDTYYAMVSYVPHKPLEVSSTEIRRLLPERKGFEYLPEKVYAEIIRLRLYGAKPELAWLRRDSQQYLNPRRIPHVEGCEREARKLAERWGEDPDTAAEAGILHDITKKLVLDEQLILCQKYGIINDTLENTSTKLLHGKTGAALARERYGVSDEVYEAIRWHTTGKPGMTLLEKIVYLADYIEPTRDFDGLDELRALAYSDLDAALALGLRMTLEELKEKGIAAHRNTVDALEYYGRR